MQEAAVQQDRKSIPNDKTLHLPACPIPEKHLPEQCAAAYDFLHDTVDGMPVEHLEAA
jgi:hypothetical protein